MHSGWVPFLYMLPTIIAVLRMRPSMIAIGLVNLVLGWTIIGWFICLVWSVMGVGGTRRA